jgi:hypothetical protein
MPDKPFHEMTDDELHNNLKFWEERTDKATGWSSAYFAAKQVKQIVDTANQRGLGFINRFPIVKEKPRC